MGAGVRAGLRSGLGSVAASVRPDRGHPRTQLGEGGQTVLGVHRASCARQRDPARDATAGHHPGRRALRLKDAAIYAAVTRFLVLGGMVSGAVSTAVQPRLGEALGRSDHESARDLFATSTAWLLMLSWPIYLMLIVFAPVVVRVFGEEYSRRRRGPGHHLRLDARRHGVRHGRHGLEHGREDDLEPLQRHLRPSPSTCRWTSCSSPTLDWSELPLDGRRRSSRPTSFR